jgi:hypothetical protein
VTEFVCGIRCGNKSENWYQGLFVGRWRRLRKKLGCIKFGEGLVIFSSVSLSLFYIRKHKDRNVKYKICVYRYIYIYIYICVYIYIYIYIGKFISPSGISDLFGTVTGMVTPKRSMSTEGETLEDSLLRYRCLICSFVAGACQQREIHSKFLSYLTGA